MLCLIVNAFNTLQKEQEHYKFVLRKYWHVLFLPDHKHTYRHHGRLQPLFHLYE